MPAYQSIGSFNTTFPVLVLYLISAKLLAALSALEGLAIHRTGEGEGDTSLVPSGLKESQKLHACDFHLLVFLYQINDTYFKQKVQSLLTSKKNAVYKDKVSISIRLSYATDVGIIRQ